MASLQVSNSLGESGASKRDASPSFFLFLLSFILPHKERGTQGVRIIIKEFIIVPRAL